MTLSPGNDLLWGVTVGRPSVRHRRFYELVRLRRLTREAVGSMTLVHSVALATNRLIIMANMLLCLKLVTAWPRLGRTDIGPSPRMNNTLTGGLSVVGPDRILLS